MYLLESYERVINILPLTGLKRIHLTPVTNLIIQEGAYILYSILYFKIHGNKFIRYYTKLNIRRKGSLKMIKNVYNNFSNLSNLYSYLDPIHSCVYFVLVNI